jgi:hypothetical protein
MAKFCYIVQSQSTQGNSVKYFILCVIPLFLAGNIHQNIEMDSLTSIAVYGALGLLQAGLIVAVGLKIHKEWPAYKAQIALQDSLRWGGGDY